MQPAQTAVARFAPHHGDLRASAGGHTTWARPDGWPAVAAALLLSWAVLYAGSAAASQLALRQERAVVSITTDSIGRGPAAPATSLYRAWTAVVAPVRPEVVAEAARDTAARARQRRGLASWEAVR